MTTEIRCQVRCFFDWAPENRTFRRGRDFATSRRLGDRTAPSPPLFRRRRGARSKRSCPFYSYPWKHPNQNIKTKRKQYKGWAETTALPEAQQQQQQQPDTREGRARFEVLDAEGRIYLWRDFLTEQECDHLIAKGEPRLRRSWVVDADSDKPGHEGATEKVSEIRTSSSMFFRRREDAVVAAVEARIARWALIPETHAEGFNMVSKRIYLHFSFCLGPRRKQKQNEAQATPAAPPRPPP
jgi:hypothetical protein